MIMTPPTEPAIPTSLVPLLVLAIIALSGVIAYLFTFYSKRDKEHAKERKEWFAERDEWAAERIRWAVERERWERTRTEIRAEYDARYRDDAERLYREQREYEETSRRTDADRMESIAKITVEANTKVAAALDKFHDIYVGPRRRTPH